MTRFASIRTGKPGAKTQANTSQIPRFSSQKINKQKTTKPEVLSRSVKAVLQEKPALKPPVARKKSVRFRVSESPNEVPIKNKGGVGEDFVFEADPDALASILNNDGISNELLRKSQAAQNKLEGKSADEYLLVDGRPSLCRRVPINRTSSIQTDGNRLSILSSRVSLGPGRVPRTSVTGRASFNIRRGSSIRQSTQDPLVSLIERRYSQRRQDENLGRPSLQPGRTSVISTKKETDKREKREAELQKSVPRRVLSVKKPNRYVASPSRRESFRHPVLSSPALRVARSTKKTPGKSRLAEQKSPRFGRNIVTALTFNDEENISPDKNGAKRNQENINPQKQLPKPNPAQKRQSFLKKPTQRKPNAPKSRIPAKNSDRYIPAVSMLPKPRSKDEINARYVEADLRNGEELVKPKVLNPSTIDNIQNINNTARQFRNKNKFEGLKKPSEYVAPTIATLKSQQSDRDPVGCGASSRLVSAEGYKAYNAPSATIAQPENSNVVTCNPQILNEAKSKAQLSNIESIGHAVSAGPNGDNLLHIMPSATENAKARSPLTFNEHKATKSDRLIPKAYNLQTEAQSLPTSQFGFPSGKVGVPLPFNGDRAAKSGELVTKGPNLQNDRASVTTARLGYPSGSDGVQLAFRSDRASRPAPVKKKSLASRLGSQRVVQVEDVLDLMQEKMVKIRRRSVKDEFCAVIRSMQMSLASVAENTEGQPDSADGMKFEAPEAAHIKSPVIKEKLPRPQTASPNQQDGRPWKEVLANESSPTWRNILNSESKQPADKSPKFNNVAPYQSKAEQQRVDEEIAEVVEEKQKIENELKKLNIEKQQQQKKQEPRIQWSSLSRSSTNKKDTKKELSATQERIQEIINSEIPPPAKSFGPTKYFDSILSPALDTSRQLDDDSFRINALSLGHKQLSHGYHGDSKCPNSGSMANDLGRPSFHADLVKNNTSSSDVKKLSHGYHDYDKCPETHNTESATINTSDRQKKGHGLHDNVQCTKLTSATERIALGESAPVGVFWGLKTPKPVFRSSEMKFEKNGAQNVMEKAPPCGHDEDGLKRLTGEKDVKSSFGVSENSYPVSSVQINSTQRSTKPDEATLNVVGLDQNRPNVTDEVCGPRPGVRKSVHWADGPVDNFAPSQAQTLKSSLNVSQDRVEKPKSANMMTWDASGFGKLEKVSSGRILPKKASPKPPESVNFSEKCPILKVISPKFEEMRIHKKSPVMKEKLAGHPSSPNMMMASPKLPEDLAKFAPQTDALMSPKLDTSGTKSGSFSPLLVPSTPILNQHEKIDFEKLSASPKLDFATTQIMLSPPLADSLLKSPVSPGQDPGSYSLIHLDPSGLQSLRIVGLEVGKKKDSRDETGRLEQSARMDTQSKSYKGFYRSTEKISHSAKVDSDDLELNDIWSNGDSNLRDNSVNSNRFDFSRCKSIDENENFTSPLEEEERKEQAFSFFQENKETKLTLLGEKGVASTQFEYRKETRDHGTLGLGNKETKTTLLEGNKVAHSRLQDKKETNDKSTLRSENEETKDTSPWKLNFSFQESKETPLFSPFERSGSVERFYEGLAKSKSAGVQIPNLLDLTISDFDTAGINVDSTPRPLWYSSVPLKPVPTGSILTDNTECKNSPALGNFRHRENMFGDYRTSSLLGFSALTDDSVISSTKDVAQPVSHSKNGQQVHGGTKSIAGRGPSVPFRIPAPKAIKPPPPQTPAALRMIRQKFRESPTPKKFRATQSPCMKRRTPQKSKILSYSPSIKRVRSQRFNEALLDEEVAILTCVRFRSNSVVQEEKAAARNASNPLGKVLMQGDETHFVPISPIPEMKKRTGGESAFSAFQH